MKKNVNQKTKMVKPAAFLVVVALLATLPMWGPEYIVSIVMLILLYMAMGQMWNLMAGYAGLLSLGMQAFIGIGGYSLAVFSTTYGMNVFVSILLGGLFSLMFAFAISPALFKMSGVYFAIGSWVVAEALLLWFSNWEFVRYAQGISITSAYQFNTSSLYYIALIAGIASVLIVFVLLRSKIGLALMAMRDNAAAAEVLGVALFKTKLFCYLLSSTMMGILGGAVYLYQAYVVPSATFSINWTVAMTFMVIIGGIGTMEGPVIGAIVYVLFNQFLYQFPGISMMILGVTAVIVILVAPNGIMGTIHNKTGFEILSARRRHDSIME